ncbi:TALE homeodomain protein [Spraguea lophii 42_110]|uniref:TALE homeodomain protein n=1 Tax=Spraguea lophii (strain 42_110) TaxID=1358809 RepID=S7WCI8_SPRLO|nr:TALE homeodomain protein [Spraguea lophii 42_110]
MCKTVSFDEILRLFIDFSHGIITQDYFLKTLSDIDFNFLEINEDNTAKILGVWEMIKYLEEKIFLEDFINDIKILKKSYFEKIESLSKIKFKKNIFSREIIKILKKWFNENINYPYPSEIEKQNLSCVTGLTLTQIKNWFINARRRILPRKNGNKVK